MKTTPIATHVRYVSMYLFTPLNHPNCLLIAALSCARPPRQRPLGPAPPPQPMDLLGQLIHQRPRSLQVQSASPAVSTAASAYRRNGVFSSGSHGSGSAGVLGEDLSDYEGSGDETDSDQERASPRSSAAKVAQIEAKTLDTTARLQSLMAQRDVVMNGAAPATAPHGEGGERVEEKAGTERNDGRDWDSDMDMATEDLQESFPPPRRSQRQSIGRQKPPLASPGKSRSLPPAVHLPAPPSQQKPATAPEANATTAAAVPLPPSTGIELSVPEEAAEDLAVAPALLPSQAPQLLAAPTPSSSHAPLPSMVAAVPGAERFSPCAEGWSLTAAGAQPPLPLSVPPLPPPPLPSPPLPSPPPPPLPSPGPRRSSGAAGRMSGASNADVEFIPLGRSSSGGGGKASPESGRATGAGAKVAGTGKKSFLYSDEEQKAMGDASRGAGKAKEKSGAIPAVRTKVKGRKLGVGAKPKVATLFTDDGQAAAKKVRVKKPGRGLML